MVAFCGRVRPKQIKQIGTHRLAFHVKGFSC